jgi:hypothetical protein
MVSPTQTVVESTSGKVMLQLTSKTEEVEVMVLLKHNRIRFENQPGLGRAHSTNAINTCNLKRFSVSYKLNFKS